MSVNYFCIAQNVRMFHRLTYIFPFLQNLQCQQMRPMSPGNPTLGSSHEGTAISIPRRLFPMRYLRYRAQKRGPIRHVR